MPVNPSDQQRAMFTIQRGPKKVDNEGAISVDASSIEPAETLSDIQDPEEKAEFRTRESKIITLLGLDTLSSAIGFEDFKNYFTLRSIESDLCQEIVEEHFYQFDPNSAGSLRGGIARGDRPFLSRVAGEARYQRGSSNALHKVHGILAKVSEGIVSTGADSDIARTAGLQMRALRHGFSDGTASALKFKKNEYDKIGVPDDLHERIEKFLGLENLEVQRPSFQYLKLAMDASAMLIPRTAPTFFNPDTRRPIESRLSQLMSPYNETITGYSPEGAMITSSGAEGGGIAELRIEHLQNNWRTSQNQHALRGVSGEGIPRAFTHLRQMPLKKNIAALMYVIQRDHEISERMGGARSQDLVRQMGMPGPPDLSMDEALSWAASSDAEGFGNILTGIAGQSKQYEIEDHESRLRNLWCRVYSLEAVGIAHAGRRGQRSSNPKPLSPGQLYQRLQGTSDSLEKLGNFAQEQYVRATNAKTAAAEGAGPGFSTNLSLPSITTHIGNFIKEMGTHIGRMIRTAEHSSPGHFNHLKNEGEDTETGSAAFDLTRWKAYGKSGSSIPEYVPGADNVSKWDNPYIARQWNKQSNLALFNFMNEAVGSMLDYLDSRMGGENQRRLDGIREIWEDFESVINEDDLYDAANKGVIHMDSQRSESKSWQFASQRVSMGLAMVLAAMKHRNLKDRSRYVLYDRLMKRFRFALFTRLTGDFDNLTSGDPSLAFNASVGNTGLFGTDEGGLGGSSVSLDMNFRDAYKAEGGRFLNNPLNMVGPTIPDAKINSVSDIANHDSIGIKINYFGYMRSHPDIGGKFKVPTDDNFTRDVGLGGNGWDTFLHTNDIGTVCNILRERSITTSEIASEDSGEHFAINMANGQAEEYYEIGWSLIGSLVANILQQMDQSIGENGILLANGLTRCGGQGLDTYVTLFFEVLGMIADAIPVTVCKSQDFNDLSPDRSEMVLLEDVDLRNAINERLGEERFTADVRDEANLFSSRSGVDELDGVGSVWSLMGQGMQEHMLRMYRNLVAARIDVSDDGDRQHFDGWAQGGVYPDGQDHNPGGNLKWDNIQQREDRLWVMSAHDAIKNTVDPEDPRRAPTTDIAIVFPKRLKAVLPQNSGLAGYSSNRAISQIGNYLTNGTFMRQSQYEHSLGGNRHNISARYISVEDSRMNGTQEVQDQYIQECSAYFERLQMSPSTGTLSDLYKLAHYMSYNDLARETASSTLYSFNQSVINRTNLVQSKVQGIMEDIHRSINPNTYIGLRVKKNLDAFDPVTSDRPLRTVAKLSPRGFGTAQLPIAAEGAVLDPNADYDPAEMMKPSASSEFTNTMKNLIIAYLDNYPIEDNREVIIAAGCPAGSDTKNLGRFAARFFSVRGQNAADLAAPRDPYSSSFKRVFKVTVERDLQTDEELNTQFTVERKYQMRYFLLPESFEGVTPNDLFEVTDSRGWIRAMAKRAKWFRAPYHHEITEGYMDPLRSLSWNVITRYHRVAEELDDMVESFILQWLQAMVSGVLIDQDLLFNNTRGANSIDIVSPSTYSSAVDKIKEKDRNSGLVPALGIDGELLDRLLTISPIPTSRNASPEDDLNYLGLAHGYRMGLVKNDEASGLVLDSYRTELDINTGAEIQVPIKADVKPWNIRLTASLMNSYMYKAPIITSMLSSSPAFDYIMFIRLRKSEFRGTGTTPVDLLSYRVTISNGQPAEG